jgi:hypothetical protein
VCGGESLQDGGGDAGGVQAVGAQELIAGGVRQESGWQGEGGRAGVRSGGGQGLGYPGAERSVGGGLLDGEHQAVRARQLEQGQVHGRDPPWVDHGDRHVMGGELLSRRQAGARQRSDCNK